MEFETQNNINQGTDSSINETSSSQVCADTCRDNNSVDIDAGSTCEQCQSQETASSFIKKDLDYNTSSMSKNEGSIESDIPKNEGTLKNQIVPPPAPLTVWNYSDQLLSDRKKSLKSKHRGAVIYAVTVTLLFLVCFGVLIYVIHSGIKNPSAITESKTIFIRKDDGSSGLLTVAEIAEKVRPSTVGISVVTSNGTSVGTGIIISSDGFIATNYHVVEDARSISVITEDSSKFSAEYKGGDELSDVALLKISPGEYKLKPAEFANSDLVVTGEQVVAIGNPSGLEYFGSVTVGYISAVRDNLKIYDSNGLVEKKMKMLQTDAALNPGNSGGPLCDMFGKVIGINTMKLIDDYDGIGFAIPSNGALTILNEIKDTGEYSGNDIAEKGVSLGISCMAVVEGEEVQISQTETIVPARSGILVVSIISNESSAAGHLKEKDIIMSFENITVKDVDEIKSILDKYHSGDTVNMIVWRDGGNVAVSFKLK